MKNNKLTVAVVILITALLFFQFNTLSRLKSLEQQVNMTHSELYGISSQISQQNVMVSEEQADYLVYGITHKDVKLNEKTGVLSMKMSLTFNKLPSGAKVYIDYKGTLEHYEVPKIDPSAGIETVSGNIVYEASQKTELTESGANVYTMDMNLDVGKNYEFALVIETPTDAFREVLGVIPVLEWSEPTYIANVEMKELFVYAGKNGTFSYAIALIPLLNSADGYTLYDTKTLYDFKDIENTVINDVVRASYKVYYKDKIIKAGDLDASPFPNPEMSKWQVTDKAKFEADPSTDFSSDIRIDYETEDSKGNIKTFSRVLF